MFAPPDAHPLAAEYPTHREALEEIESLRQDGADDGETIDRLRGEKEHAQKELRDALARLRELERELALIDAAVRRVA